MTLLTLVGALAGTLAISALYRSFRNVRIVRPAVLDPSGSAYPVSEVRLASGEAVNFLDTGGAGAATAVLLIPGADGIHQTWRYQVPALAAGRRVLAADLRNRIDGNDTFDTLVDDALAICDAAGVERVVVIGQSLGGAIAMRLVSRHPERVAAVAIVNSLARISYEHVGLNRTLLIPVAMATTRYLPTSLARAAACPWSRWSVWVFDSSPGWRRVVDYVLWTGPRTVSPAVSNRRVRLLRGEDLRPELEHFDVPALVVKGPCDTYVPVDWSRDIASRIPRAEYVEIPTTGHCSHVAMPEEFNAVLADWLDRVDEQGGGKEVET